MTIHSHKPVTQEDINWATHEYKKQNNMSSQKTNMVAINNIQLGGGASGGTSVQEAILEIDPTVFTRQHNENDVAFASRCIELIAQARDTSIQYAIDNFVQNGVVPDSEYILRQIFQNASYAEKNINILLKDLRKTPLLPAFQLLIAIKKQPSEREDVEMEELQSMMELMDIDDGSVKNKKFVSCAQDFLGKHIRDEKVLVELAARPDFGIEILSEMESPLRHDPQFIKGLLKKLEERIQSNPELKKSIFILKGMSPEIKKDSEIVLQAIRLNGLQLKDLLDSDCLGHYETLATAAIQDNPDAKQYIQSSYEVVKGMDDKDEVQSRKRPSESALSLRSIKEEPPEKRSKNK